MLLLAAVSFFYHRYQDEQRLLISGPALWGLALAQIPYAISLWWLLTLDERKGASLAVGWGSLALGINLPLLPGVRERYAEKEIALGALVVAFLFPLVQLAWVWCSVKAHRQIPAKPGERSSLTVGFVRALGFLLLLMLVVIVATISDRSLMHRNVYESQRRATVALQRIAACAAQYRSARPAKGFPGNLGALGPGGTGCLGPRLAAGEKDGYRFQFTPGATDPSGRRGGYAILARPKIDFRPVVYWMDHTGAIHYTYELRDATAADPVVQ